MIHHAYLLYGHDEKARTLFIEKIIAELSPLFTHTFGKEKPIGISESHEIQRRAYIAVPSGSQVFFIWQTDAMTPEAGEALLKIIEEPPKGSYFILVSNSNSLPATILSRVQQVPFLNGAKAKGESEVPDEAFFDTEIMRLKSELESSAHQKQVVTPTIVRKLKAAVQLSTMLRTTRINPRYIIESYKLTR